MKKTRPIIGMFIRRKNYLIKKALSLYKKVEDVYKRKKSLESTITNSKSTQPRESSRSSERERSKSGMTRRRNVLATLKSLFKPEINLQSI